MNETNPKAIHRKLFSRIFLMGFLIALVSGYAVWQLEKKEIDHSILIRTENGFKRLNNQIRHLLNNPDAFNPAEIEKQLVTLLSQREQFRIGQYVWLGIYSPNGKPVAQVPDNTYEHIKKVESVTGKVSRDARKHGRMEIDVMALGAAPHIQIVAPLSNDLGETAAYGETIFAVSEETLAAIRSRALKLAMAAMAIVLATTVLIYPVIFSLLRQVTALSAKLFDANLEMLTVLGSAIAKRDSDTDAHNYRVTIISVKLAEQIGLAAAVIRHLIKGAFLHDVGKIGIEDGILHKPGRLNADEFAVMQQHVPMGLDIVNKAEWLKEGQDIVACHHEKYDSSGYMHGLTGKKIPKTARIFAIADVFDALTSQRPYKDPFSYEKTMEILTAGRGSHFDPDILDQFEKISQAIYGTYAGREDEILKKELDAIINKYFYT